MVTYLPGEDFLAVAGGGLVLVSGELSPDAVTRIWNDMRDGDAFAAVLSVLLETVGPNMAALPDFVVVTITPGGARVIVRGSRFVRVTTEHGAREEVGALGVATWTDRTIADATAIEIGPEGAGQPLPVRDGVVRASRASWVRGDAVVAETSATAPVVEPTPVVEAALPVEPVTPATATPVTEPSPSEETLLPAASDTVVSVEPAVEPAGEPSVEVSAYDDLIFGETRISSVEDAAVRVDVEDHAAAGIVSGIPSSRSAAHSTAPPPPPPPPPQSVQPSMQQGDHDGETISAEQLAALRAQLGGGGVPKPAGAAGTPASPAVLRVSTGERVVLDRSAVVGRRPRAVRATGSVPHLVTVSSPEREVSSSHIELRVEGTDVVAVDLDTTNGTRLLRIGSDPVRMHPGEPTLLVSGDQLDLGDGIVLEFEGL
ncbi:FHA domain-containing protein [Microbacterium sp. UBA837]|uniref:FHA domain-containing protein n=1 Tax=Microbacterium sp. UBA837 TaxID=1946956 RepID=UPI0025EB3DDB|nr:FHA domain-containing protein [Microbacterium sp. UBA837]|tara:strand:- start:7492 stop:8778 length:1287 start_codon:yes stop_codon:yes gene_type:complete